VLPLITTLTMFLRIMRTILNYPQARPTLWRYLTHGYEVGQSRACCSAGALRRSCS
jgi:hypothetical protein